MNEAIQIREAVQQREGIRKGAAQRICAETVGVNWRSWQKWELGERKPNPALLELARIKLGLD